MGLGIGEKLIMKAFKKWLKRSLIEANKKYKAHDPILYIKEERVWRAALEEVVKQIEIGNKTKSYTEDILIAVENWIEKELGE